MSEDQQMPPVDPGKLRSAMGLFLTGVTVVTVTGADQVPYGLTVNSFNSVSLSPPLVLWSLDKRNEKLDLFRSANGFAVNIMAADQADICQFFASAETDRFSACDWRFGAYGQPLIEGALAALECRPWAEYDGGDHVIFVGEVMSIQQKTGAPLAFFDGKLGHYEQS